MKRYAEFEVQIEILEVVTVIKRVSWGANRGDEEALARSEAWEEIQAQYPNAHTEVITVTDFSFD